MLLPLLLTMTFTQARSPEHDGVPPSWEVVPIPRYADYGSPRDFITVGRAAIVRAQGSPYETIRDAAGELAAESTITEEELAGILRAAGVADVAAVPDDAAACEPYDTLFVLGPPRGNQVADAAFGKLGLSFRRWDDPNTSDDDFRHWSDLGPEGYVLKVGRLRGKAIVLLAGYDRDDRGRFHGAGTFYALQSLRQLLVPGDEGLRIKTAEIVDKPLVAVRGCFSGFDPSEDQQLRDIELMPRIKANQNIYWYGNNLAAYNLEAAGHFRYPWRPEQLEAFHKFGKYCRERFVTMVFCMNPDHYNVDWAAAKTFDGSRKDPLHYDPDHPVEPEFQRLWAELGYEVRNDVDILAAKFAQINKVVPGAMLQMMNEDDLFGLVHEDDKALFGAETGDPAQDARNYGRARATFLAGLYHRVRELCPDSADVVPLCPPSQLCYQHILDRNEGGSREFLDAFTAALGEMGLRDRMPILTTGGGTAAEVLTSEAIDRFRGWGNGAPVLICDNNFASGFHLGAYEPDPEGPRSPYQIDETLPAGFRDRELYKRLWGISWNSAMDQHTLAWCQAQYMWNMLALDRDRINELATRKETSAASYRLVKSLFSEFDNPACYTPDCQPPYRVKTITDTVAFPSDGWTYRMDYPDGRRREAERVRAKLQRLLPRLDAEWDNERERNAFLKWLAHPALTFIDVYLAYGYIRGWEGGRADAGLTREALRDLFLEADDIQQRYFAGPKTAPGRLPVDHHYYSGHLHYLYWDGAFKQPPQSPEEATTYVDVWKEGLLGRFYEPVLSVAPGDMPDGDGRLLSGWGPAGEADGASFRIVDGEAVLEVEEAAGGVDLVRLRIAAEDNGVPEPARITLQIGDLTHEDAVCKARWLNWPLPSTQQVARLAIRSDKPIRLLAIELHRHSSGDKGTR